MPGGTADKTFAFGFFTLSYLTRLGWAARIRAGMMATKLLKIMSAVVCVAHLAGCVRPGRIDPTVLNRYQRSVLMRSPQRRGSDGLGLVRPVETIGPKLKVVSKDGKTRIELTLQEAVQRALANSPIIAVVGFDPAVSREEMIAAAAAFDVVLFGSYDYRRIDDRPSNIFGGGQTDLQVFEAGARQDLVTGGSWSVAYSFSRTWDSSTFKSMAIQYEPRLVLEITQPLLRNAWPQFNLAQLRIARTNRRISESAFRSQVEAVVTDVTSSYLTLRRERRALKIQEILLGMAVKTLERVKARAEIDATAVQIKQTEAAVANRKLSVIEAKYQILKSQDALIRLLSDPQINLSAEVEIVPVTPLGREQVKLDVADQLLTALANSPKLTQARLAIALADIDVSVAENQLLPKLDLTGSVGYQGLAGTRHEAHEKMGTLDYLSYSVGISFEYPIGNRARRADLRKAEFQRLRKIAELQNTADGVSQTVRDRIHLVRRHWQAIPLARAALNAARVELQGLEDIERIRGKLTPEFLQLKLRAQEAVAAGELVEIDAVRFYNFSLVDLYTATGTILKIQGVQIPGATMDLPAAVSAAAGESDWSKDPAAGKPPIAE